MVCAVAVVDLILEQTGITRPAQTSRLNFVHPPGTRPHHSTFQQSEDLSPHNIFPVQTLLGVAVLTMSATDTITLTERQRKPKTVLLPENERFLMACSDISSALIEAWESPTNKDLNLNSLRAKMAKRHRLSNMPPLTAIIAAIPEHYKVLLQLPSHSNNMSEANYESRNISFLS